MTRSIKARAAIALFAAAVPALLAGGASAHQPDIIIGGFQYFWSTGLELDGGPAGYVSTPAGAQQVNDGAGADDSIASITNRDPVRHTFTHCRPACTPSDPAFSPAFDVEIGPAAAATPAQIDAINSALAPGTYLVMCRVHTWMRARLNVG